MTCLETATIFHKILCLNCQQLLLWISHLHHCTSNCKEKEHVDSFKALKAQLLPSKIFEISLKPFSWKRLLNQLQCAYVRACPHTQPTLNNSLIHSPLHWYQLTSGYAGSYWSSGGEKLERRSGWKPAISFCFSGSEQVLSGRLVHSFTSALSTLASIVLSKHSLSYCQAAPHDLWGVLKGSQPYKINGFL